MQIDELVVKLILDAKEYAKGQKDAADALGKTKESAVASSKAIEASALSASQGVEKLGRQFLGLFALLTGAAGLKAFLSDLTTADASLGRTAKNLDMSGRALSAWQGAAEVAGGSAQSITGSMAGLSNAMQTAALTGNNTLAPVFRALGINLATTGGKARDMTGIMFDLNRTAQGMDPARFAAMMHMVGVDDGTINLLEKSTAEFGKLYAEQQKYAANSEDIEAAQSRQSGWRQLSLTVVSLGRSIATALTPAMVGAMKAVQDWADKNQEWIKTSIVEKVGQFVDYLRGLDWGSIGRQAGEFAASVKSIAIAFDETLKSVNSNSPLFKAFEAFGLMLSASVIARLAGVAAGITRIGALPIPPVLASALGLAGAVAVGASAESTPDAETQKRQADFAKENPDAPKTIFGALANWWRNNASTSAGGTGPDAATRAAEIEKRQVEQRAAEAAANAKTGQGHGFFNDLWDYLKKKAGLGDGDPRTRDAISDTAKATGEMRDILKRQADGVSGADAASGGGGGTIIERVRHTLRNARMAAGAGYTPAGGGGTTPARGALAANQKEAYAAALKEGLSPTAARALVSNMSGEGLANDAHRVHWDGTHNSGGIVQWDPQRAAAIKAQFGKLPWEMSVGDQTKAAIWEINNNPRFAPTARALKGDNGPAMIGALVDNYEVPANKAKAKAERMGYYRGFNPAEPPSPSAMAPAPAGTSAKAISDAEAFAARQRVIAGSRNPADRAIVERYQTQQNTTHAVTYNDLGRHLMNLMRHAHQLTRHDADKPVRVLPVGRDGAPVHEHAAAMARMTQMASMGRYVSNSTSSSHTEHHMHGDINVHTRATDAKGIAGDLGPYLFQGGDARQANRGLA